MVPINSMSLTWFCFIDPPVSRDDAVAAWISILCAKMNCLARSTLYIVVLGWDWGSPHVTSFSCMFISVRNTAITNSAVFVLYLSIVDNAVLAPYVSGHGSVFYKVGEQARFAGVMDVRRE